MVYLPKGCRSSTQSKSAGTGSRGMSPSGSTSPRSTTCAGPSRCLRGRRGSATTSTSSSTPTLRPTRWPQRPRRRATRASPPRRRRRPAAGVPLLVMWLDVSGSYKDAKAIPLPSWGCTWRNFGQTSRLQRFHAMSTCHPSS